MVVTNINGIWAVNICKSCFGRVTLVKETRTWSRETTYRQSETQGEKGIGCYLVTSLGQGLYSYLALLAFHFLFQHCHELVCSILTFLGWPSTCFGSQPAVCPYLTVEADWVWLKLHEWDFVTEPGIWSSRRHFCGHCKTHWKALTEARIRDYTAKDGYFISIYKTEKQHTPHFCFGGCSAKWWCVTCMDN